MAQMTSAELIAKMQSALADLADAEQRYAELQAAGRHAWRELPPKVADMRTMSSTPMKDAMADWGLAHDRIRSYSSAATAMLLQEFLHPADAWAEVGS